jgi:hypothetical protein
MIVSFYPRGKERCAEKVFQDVDDTVEEFEYLERFRIGGGGAEEEQLVLDD